jgi:hypothetical protein
VSSLCPRSTPANFNAMAIRDRFRRARKSISSSSTTNTSHIDPTPDVPEPELSKSPSRLAKTFSWRSNKSKKPEDSRPEPPAERPPTETNLRHQELLSAFTMTFGRRRPSQGGRMSFGGVSGISPGNSRQGSLDAGASRGSTDRSPYGNPRMSALAHEVPTVDTVAEDSEGTRTP